MIDEKRFEQILEFGFVMEGVCEETVEIIRLARLGLWAEKHAVPALKLADEEFQDRENLGSKEGLERYRKAMDTADSALAALKAIGV